MPKAQSAGILVYRLSGGMIEVLLVHPGGPFWARKDLGAWSIPKGQYDDTEEPLAAARRELQEETGLELDGTFIPLGSVKQKSGKVVTAWAVEGDCDAATIRSMTFSMEWPPKSGKMADFPEVDRAEWFGLSEAAQKLNPSQVGFLDKLRRKLEITDHKSSA